MTQMWERMLRPFLEAQWNFYSSYDYGKSPHPPMGTQGMQYEKWGSRFRKESFPGRGARLIMSIEFKLNSEIGITDPALQITSETGFKTPDSITSGQASQRSDCASVSGSNRTRREEAAPGRKLHVGIPATQPHRTTGIEHPHYLTEYRWMANEETQWIIREWEKGAQSDLSLGTQKKP